MNKITKLIIGLLTVCLVIGIWGLGYFTQSRLYPAKAKFIELTKIEVVEKIVKVPIEVEKTVFVEVEKVTTERVFIPVKIRPFTSLYELNKWLEDYKTNLHFWGSTRFNIIDCEDFVLFSMVIAAAEDGYLMVVQNIVRDAHMVAATPIGNSMYYIEATPNGALDRKFKEVWLGYHLDKATSPNNLDDDDDRDEGNNGKPPHPPKSPHPPKPPKTDKPDKP